jgi:hypothetical protein
MAPFKPGARPQNPGLVSLNSLRRLVAETDDEFWARMEREHPGQQPNTQRDTPLSADLAGQDFPDPEEAHHPDPYAHPDSWSDTDWDDLVPENMSLRDHSKLLRSGGMRWDGDNRYPVYTHEANRKIVDSDGEPAYANEGHVIQHNTNHHGPVLPTEDDPEPHVGAYPWSHTYYPAGQSDDRGLTKGYNSVDQALHATRQLSLWGARHPESREVLEGYRYVGDDMPYDPSEELPHEAAQRMRHGAFRVSAFDPERGEFLYDIDTPNYYRRDYPPSAGSSTAQPLFRFKGRDEDYYDPPEDEEGYASPDSILFEAPHHHPSYEHCKGCFDRGLNLAPGSSIHKDPSEWVGAHKYEPMEELPPGVRLAAERTRRQKYDYGSCPVCDAEVNELCTSTRSDTWGKPISRPHPEREKVLLE